MIGQGRSASLLLHHLRAPHTNLIQRSLRFTPLRAAGMATNSEGIPMQVISEGTAHMHYDPKETVFYNKVQVLNRDLSIQVIKLYSEKLREEKLALIEKRNAKAASKGNLAAVALNSEQATAEAEQGITILDALAASGLRSIRYLKEVPKVKHLTINDLSPVATALALDNCHRNHVELSKVIISNQDATVLMYSHREATKQFDVIDLDPYGSAVPFLDGAVQAVANGGLLCVTCTDMTALAGSYPEVCFSKYQSIPVKAKYNHEMGLRILLHAIDSTANKYKRHIVPWLSLSVDFYVRVFVRVFESPAEVKNSMLRRSFVYQCMQSPTFFVQPMGKRNPPHRSIARDTTKKNHSKQRGEAAPDQKEEEEAENPSTPSAAPPAGAVEGGSYTAAAHHIPFECPDTGSRMKMGGPFWSDPIHKQEIVDELLSRVLTYAKEENHPVDEQFPIPTARRLGGILGSIVDELKDVPLHYSIGELASAAGITVPTLAEVQAALQSAGYRYSAFHHDPLALKTDAPPQVVWDMIRLYAKDHPPVFSKKTGQSALSKRILDRPITTVMDFTHTKRAAKPLPRFPPNPEANWGPKRRAGRPAPGGEKKGEEMEMEEEPAKVARTS